MLTVTPSTDRRVCAYESSLVSVGPVQISQLAVRSTRTEKDSSGHEHQTDSVSYFTDPPRGNITDVRRVLIDAWSAPAERLNNLVFKK